MAQRVFHALGWFGAFGVGWGALGTSRPENVDFVRDIVPLLKSKCGVCHGAESSSAGLRMDSSLGVKKGGSGGPLFIPGDSAGSLLVQRILGEGGKPRMPMGFAPLSDVEIRKIKDWIYSGASFASVTGEKHWAYISPKRPTLPLVDFLPEG